MTTYYSFVASYKHEPEFYTTMLEALSKARGTIIVRKEGGTDQVQQGEALMSGKGIHIINDFASLEMADYMRANLPQHIIPPHVYELIQTILCSPQAPDVILEPAKACLLGALVPYIPRHDTIGILAEYLTNYNPKTEYSHFATLAMLTTNKDEAEARLQELLKVTLEFATIIGDGKDTLEEAAAKAGMSDEIDILAEELLNMMKDKL